MFSMRARTLSGLSSFLLRSLGLSGSRWPSAHWPSPRALRGRAVGPAGVLLGAMSAILRVSWARSDAHGFSEDLVTSVSGGGRGVLRARAIQIGRRQEARHIALRTRP